MSTPHLPGDARRPRSTSGFSAGMLPAVICFRHLHAACRSRRCCGPPPRAFRFLTPEQQAYPAGRGAAAVARGVADARTGSGNPPPARTSPRALADPPDGAATRRGARRRAAAGGGGMRQGEPYGQSTSRLQYRCVLCLRRSASVN
jgi:hypothetical protein